MILFRLISFAIRLTTAFVFVAILQISWKGKPLESYLSQWGQKIAGPPVLKEAGEKNRSSVQIPPVQTLPWSGAKSAFFSSSIPRPPKEGGQALISEAEKPPSIIYNAAWTKPLQQIIASFL